METDRNIYLDCKINMDKCRICLLNKRKLYSLYEPTNGQSCAEMILSLSDIKLSKFDGLPQNICSRCNTQLIEAYNFKKEIERSNEILHHTENLKKISFYNLDDIKIKIEITEHFSPETKTNFEAYIKDGETSTNYKNITITKIESPIVNVKTEPQTISDFIDHFKDNADDSFETDYHATWDDDDGSDEDYCFPMAKTKYKKKHKRKNKADSNINVKKTPANIPIKKMCIKPVIMNDIRVLATKNKKPTDKLKLKSKKYLRVEMCNYCGRMVQNIKGHILQHTGERSHKCDICKKGFLTHISLLHHQKIHYTERTFKCDQCTAIFQFSSGLKSHLLTHLDERKYECDICKKTYKKNYSLIRHKMTHNLANKCIKCDLCNMTFLSNHALKHHVRVHTGERPYKCEICSQPYSYKHDFNRHCFKKHGVFLKRRSIYVMNKEVLKKEKAIMRDLMLKLQDFTKDSEPINPYDGPQADLAFKQAIKDLKSKPIPANF